MFFNKILSSGFRSNLIQFTFRSFSSLQQSFQLKSTISASATIPSTPLQICVQDSSFLRPINFVLNQAAGFKVKGQLRLRCKDCFFVMRQQRLYILCKTHPRHKQMSMKPRDKKSWILTHATQSKIRPY